MPEQDEYVPKGDDECTAVALGLILGLFERFGRGLTEFSPALDLLPTAIGHPHYMRKSDLARGIERLARAGYVTLTTTDYMHPDGVVKVSRGGALAFERYFQAKRAGQTSPELPDEVQDPPALPGQLTYVDARRLEGPPAPSPRTVEGKRLPDGSSFKPGPETL